MNVLIDIGHPGHVHLYKNLFFELQKRGHITIVTVKDIPIAKSLLKAFQIPYICIGKKRDSILGKILNQILFNFKIWKIVKRQKIDIGIGTSVSLVQVSRFTKMKSILLDDDDDDGQPLFVKFAHPFCDYLISPDALAHSRKRKDTIYYPGFHELAYLHPKVFTPDKAVLKDIGVKPGENFFLLRFTAFKAHHDTGAKGLSVGQKLELIEILKNFGKVFITTEREPEEKLKPYLIAVSPEKIHSVISFSSLFISDSQTMTSEAAVLGTPSIRCNTFADQVSTIKEEEHKYKLTFSFRPEQFSQLMSKVKELILLPDRQNIFKQRREKLLNDKIYPTEFYTWLIENEKNIKSTEFNENFFKQFWNK